jgi:hypothetical protein
MVATRSTVAFCSVSRTAKRRGKKNIMNTATPNDPKARDEGPRLLEIDPNVDEPHSKAAFVCG